MFKRWNNLSRFPKPLAGDWLVIIISLILVVVSFFTFWSHQPATVLRIRNSNKIYGEFSLMQTKRLQVRGKIGISIIDIAQGKVRFQHAPCSNQYCVHQGWLSHAGQTAICMPNQISIELLGTVKQMDTLSY